MSKTLFVILALGSLGATALAQEPAPAGGNAAPPRKPRFVPTAATPAPEKESILQKIFGSRQGRRTLFPPPPPPKPQPTPAPAAPKATPKPVRKPAPMTKTPEPTEPPPEATPAPSKKKRTKPKAVAEETKPEAVSPEPTDATKTPKENVEPPAPAPETPAPTSGKKSRRVKTPPVAKAPVLAEPPANADPETREKYRFDVAKAKAEGDPEVLELKAKADTAASDDEARNAQRDYNKALFAKMRQIDDTLGERIGQMEAAILKRLEEK